VRENRVSEEAESHSESSEETGAIITSNSH